MTNIYDELKEIQGQRLLAVIPQRNDLELHFDNAVVAIEDLDGIRVFKVVERILAQEEARSSWIC